MASDLAMVAGLHRRHEVLPCSESRRHRRAARGLGAEDHVLLLRHQPEPDQLTETLVDLGQLGSAATGITTWSGIRQPSCSAISKASVFDPSA